MGKEKMQQAFPCENDPLVRRNNGKFHYLYRYRHCFFDFMMATYRCLPITVYNIIIRY